MIEPRLNELPGKARLALGFFNSLIRRIECTKPISGTAIKLDQKPDGIVVSIDLKEYKLNVCSNGTPDTITVYGKK